MTGSTVFLSGLAAAPGSPLARYLPPLPVGVAAGWLAGILPHEGADRPWVLDPFSASPQPAIEAARAGFRVVAAANNPVSRFLLEKAANPPSEGELRAALADLAASYKGEERIEPHIRSLYKTQCAQCGQEVSADAFLWDRGASAPYGRIYGCPRCGDSGERPATEDDAIRAARFSASGMHRSRALERVAPLDDPDRPHAEEALSVYLPRAVYALFTLINKLDSLASPATHPNRRAALAALILSACDQANTMWPYPSGRARPRQLTTPTRFRENNVWLALEEAVDHWAAGGGSHALQLTIWPEPPPDSGGICIYEGRLRDLADGLRAIPVGAVLAALPRPNQAFWALSALWAGWLWGREAAAPFKSVLRRRRYDWAWHSTALHAALRSLAPVLKPSTPFLGLVSEAEPAFITAAVVAAGMAGFDLSGIALREESGQAHLHWQQGEISATPAGRAAAIQQAGIQRASQAYLRARGQPAPYLCLHAAALSSLAASQWLKAQAEADPADVMAEVQGALLKVFSDRNVFRRYGGSEHSLDVGQWWLLNPERGKEKCEDPLADQVEIALVRLLQKRPGASLAEVDWELCKAFPGLLTPGLDLIRACLDSYAEQQPAADDGWRLREADAPKVRRADLAAISRLLVEAGQRLGFESEDRSPLLWREPGGEVGYAFYVLASAVIGKFIAGPAYPPEKSIIVYPGSRAGLIAFKMGEDPRLFQATEAGWRFVKFRHIRRLAEDVGLTRQSFDRQLGLDPLTNKDPQIQLL